MSELARTLVEDLRAALRGLRRAPRYTLTVTVTLALGIGTSVAMFCLVDLILFRPLDVAQPERLVRLFAHWPQEAKVAAQVAFSDELSSSSFPAFADYRDQATSFEALAAYADWMPVHLVTEGAPERVTAAVVSGRYFDVVGVRPALGRLLAPADDGAPGAQAVAVLGHQLWRRRFGADPGVVGSVVKINRQPFTVVGVAPERFLGVGLDARPQVFLPMAMAAAASPTFDLKDLFAERRMSWLDIVGRLKPGVSAEAAQAELDAIATRRDTAQAAGVKEPRPYLVPAERAAIDLARRDEADRVSWLLLATCGALLLIACANAAGMALVRGERRQAEVAVKLALGASRLRLMRELLAEAAIASLAACVVGLLLAAWIVQAVVAVVPPDFPLPLREARSVLDARVIAWALGAAALSAALAALMPVLRASGARGRRRDTAPAGGRVTRAGVRGALVAGQVALAAVLLTGAGLLVRTLRNVTSLAPGYDVDGALTATMDLGRQGYPEERWVPVFESVRERLSAVPGVREAALAMSVPVSPSGMRMTITVDGYTPPADDVANVDVNVVTPGYFRTMGIALLAGRDFSGGDGRQAPGVAVVSRAMARKFWGSDAVVGRRIRLGKQGELEVVGLAADAMVRGLREPPIPVMYRPLAQFPRARMSLVARAAGDPRHLPAAVQAAVREVDPELPLFGVLTLRERLGSAAARERLLALLLGALAVAALLLTAGGLYAVVAYWVESRRRELGIRMAVGADARDVLSLVLRRGAWLAAIGVAAGLAGAWLLAPRLRSLLFHIEPLDAYNLLTVALVLLAAALLASFIPARRAARIDPAVALRYE